MLLHFRQGIVEAQLPAFFRVTYPSVDLIVTDTNTTVAFAAGSKDYLHTEQESVAAAWGPLHLGIDQWLYWDLDIRTGQRSFGITTREPIVASTMPTSPGSDQHWFDTSSNEMKVWTGNVWVKRIRAFACKLAQGRVPVSMSSNAPSYLGTQVGNNTDTFAGHIMYDATTGNALKNAQGMFITSEDRLSTKTISLSAVKVASIIIEGEAQQNMASHTIVKFSEFGKIVHADQFVADQPIQFGIIETNAVVGQTVNVVTSGMVSSNSFDFSALGVNTLLYCSASGQLVAEPVVPAQKPVAIVVDRKTIQLGVALANIDGGPGNIPLATETVYGISRLSVPAEDVDDPIVVGDNDPRLTNARPPAFHTHPINEVIQLQDALDSKVNRSGDVMTGHLFLHADPTQEMHAATKKYVDDQATQAAGSNTYVQFNRNGSFGASSALTFLDGTDVDPNTAILKIGDHIDVQNAVIVSAQEFRITAGGRQDFVAHDLVLQGGGSYASGDVTGSSSIRAGNVYLRGGWAVDNVPDASFGGNAHVIGGTGYSTNGSAYVDGGAFMYMDGSTPSNGGNAYLRGGAVGTEKTGGDAIVAGGTKLAYPGVAGRVVLRTDNSDRLIISDRGEWLLNGIDPGQPGQVLTSRGSLPPQWSDGGITNVPISTLSNAEGYNTIDNMFFVQKWRWVLDESNRNEAGLNLQNHSTDPPLQYTHLDLAESTMGDGGWSRNPDPAEAGLSQENTLHWHGDFATVGYESYAYGYEIGEGDGVFLPPGSLIAPYQTAGVNPSFHHYLGHSPVGNNERRITVRFMPVSWYGYIGGTIGIYTNSDDQAVVGPNVTMIDLATADVSFPDGSISTLINPSFGGFDVGVEYTMDITLKYTKDQYRPIDVFLEVWDTNDVYTRGSVGGSYASNSSVFKFGIVGIVSQAIDGNGVAILSTESGTSLVGERDGRPATLRVSTADNSKYRSLVINEYGDAYQGNEFLSVDGTGVVQIGGMGFNSAFEPFMYTHRIQPSFNSPLHPPSSTVIINGGNVQYNPSECLIADIDPSGSAGARQYDRSGGSVVLQGGPGVWGSNTTGFPREEDQCSNGGQVILTGGRTNDGDIYPYSQYNGYGATGYGGDVHIYGGDLRETEQQAGFAGNVKIRGGVGPFNGMVTIGAGIDSPAVFNNTSSSSIEITETAIKLEVKDTTAVSTFQITSNNIDISGTLGSAGKVITHDGTRVVWGNITSLDGYTVALTAHNVTALGVGAFGNHRYYDGWVDNNTAIGNYSLNSLTNGARNTAVGADAMRTSVHYFGQTPYDNVAVGYQSGYKIQGTADGAAHSNVAIGSRSLANITFSQNNTIVGAKAAEMLLSGTSNVMVGSRSGQALSTGALNTLVGMDTYAFAASGSNNTALGTTALAYLQSGAIADSLSNATGIGYSARVSGSNQVQLGNSSTTTYVYGTVQNRSDERDKADIRPTVLGIDFINKINAVDYKWDMRDDYLVTSHTTDENGEITPTVTHLPKDGSKKRNRYHHGVIAQQVKQVCDELGVDFGGYQHHSINNGDDTMTIGYDEFIAPLISSIQYLYKQNQELRQAIMDIQTKLGAD